MTPSEASSLLRNIAAKIDASKKPARALVIRDIRVALSAIAQEQQEVTSQQQQGQQQQALPKSESGKSMIKKLMDDLGEAIDSGDSTKAEKTLDALGKAIKV